MNKVSENLPHFEAKDFHYKFDMQFPHHGNALFEDGGRLFIGNVVDDTVENVEEVSLVEALRWYALLIQIEPESEGTTELLCWMAAKELSKKDGGPACDQRN